MVMVIRTSTSLNIPIGASKSEQGQNKMLDLLVYECTLDLGSLRSFINRNEKPNFEKRVITIMRL